MRNAIIVMLAIVLPLWLGCEEQWPQYDEPADVLEGSVQRITSDTVLVVLDPDDLVLGGEPTRIRIYLKNKHFQLLEGVSLVTGYMKFYAFAPSPKVASLGITRNNILSPPLFQDRLAIPPGDSAKLEVSWNHNAVGGRIYNGSPYVEHFEGTTRIRTYQSISITIETEVQIFERVQPIRTSPLAFTIVVKEFKLGAR